MKGAWKIPASLLLLSLPFSRLSRGADLPEKDVPSLFYRANDLYEGGDYEGSAGLYQALVDEGHINGYIFFNLGNTFMRLGDTARAILNYRRARIFLPLWGDLKANLDFARERVKDRIAPPAPPPFLGTIFFWYFPLSPLAALHLFTGSYILFWCYLLYRLISGKKVLSVPLYLFLALVIVLAGSLFFKLRGLHLEKGGVVMEEEVTVRSGNDPSSVPLFTLHKGAEIMIEDEREGYFRISLPDMKQGWLPSKSVERIKVW